MQAVARELAEIAARLVAVCARLAEEPGPDDLVTEKDARGIARVSARTLREARKSGALVMFGKQGHRTVKRADLMRWVESRATKPTTGPDDADIERRMRRLAGGR